MDKKEEILKMAVVAGASYAIRYKEEHPRASESETMGYVTKSMRKIIKDLKEG